MLTRPVGLAFVLCGLSMAGAAAQVCAGYPMKAGSFALTLTSAYESLPKSDAHSLGARWKVHNRFALEGHGGVGFQSHEPQSRIGANVSYELPLGSFSLCMMLGVERRFLRYDVVEFEPCLGICPFWDVASARFAGGPTVRLARAAYDWFLPVGIGLGYHQVYGRVSLFSFVQPQLLFSRETWDYRDLNDANSPFTRFFIDDVTGGALRGGTGLRFGHILFAVEKQLATNDEATYVALRMGYVSH